MVVDGEPVTASATLSSPGAELTSPSQSQRVIITLGPSSGRRLSTPSRSPERTAYSPSEGWQRASSEPEKATSAASVPAGAIRDSLGDEETVRSDAFSAFSPPSWLSQARAEDAVTPVEAAKGLERQADELAAMSAARIMQEKALASERRTSRSEKLFANFDKQAKAAWSIEFEADALAAQSENRFLQAEVHRLLAERAAEQVSTGRAIAEMEASVSRLQAERESERALMREVRAGLEVATTRLSEGYEVKLRQLEDENAALRSSVHRLEAELSDTRSQHLQEKLLEKRWRSAVVGRIMASRSTSTISEMGRICLLSWYGLLAVKSSDASSRRAAAERRRLCARATTAWANSCDGALKRNCLACWHSVAKQRRGGRRRAQITAEALWRSMFLESRASTRMLFLGWRIHAAVIVDDSRPSKGPQAMAGPGRREIYAHRHLTGFRERTAMRSVMHMLRELRRSCLDNWVAAIREARLLRAAEADRHDMLQRLALGRTEAESDRLAAEELVTRYAAEANARCQGLERSAQRQIAEAEALAERQIAVAREEAETKCQTAEDRAAEKVQQVEFACQIAEDRAARAAAVAESAAAADAARHVADVEGERREAAEAGARVLMDQRLEYAKAESRLAATEDREHQLRDEVRRLTDSLSDAERQAAEQVQASASDLKQLQAEFAEAVRFISSMESSEAALQLEEASCAGRLARATQQATDRAAEVAELRLSLQSERAALKATRGELRGESRSATPMANSPLQGGTSARSLQPADWSPGSNDGEFKPRGGLKDLDDVAKKWRLERGHSVAAILKSGTMYDPFSVADEGYANAVS
eukprot:TRINITY_DN29055_c0_g1_i1.p1 TRINITY_DN29055_c0_g1~~TRINITY_DN29055_c0_g1_i1.p1  ORF type:complete len:824 (-),score=183.96 TRINITY_DN29055_c0_g1_i1:17-2488(-)